MIKIKNSQKLRGGYYTPLELAYFLSNWVKEIKPEKVLEPSCGDGQFVEVISRLLPSVELTGVELYASEAKKAKERGNSDAEIVVSDVFSWYENKNLDNSYDAVVGNPPFIRYQNFPKVYSEPAFRLMRKEGLNPSKLTNAWVPFVTLATRALKKGGRIAMVLPAELLQVSYASQLRGYLSRKYKNLTIITFKKLLFPDAQQEIVLLLGDREDVFTSNFSFLELNDIKDLRPDILKDNKRIHLDHSRDKWIKYYLSPSELDLLQSLENNNKVIHLGEIADVDVGVVTGNNDFFVLNQEMVRQWGLEKYSTPIVARSNQLKGLKYSDSDLKIFSKSGERVYLFQVNKKQRSYKLPPNVVDYIKEGEKQGFHQSYKCKIRLPDWWVVPSVWRPDAFLLRQIHEGPRIISNKTPATSTDTVHRIRIRDKDYSGDLLATLSVNSLTFALAEIRGRSYGGGVLELEPSEAESLLLPKIKISPLQLSKLDRVVREQPIEKTLDIFDKLTLRPVGFSDRDIVRFREIWRKLNLRRISRRKD